MLYGAWVAAVSFYRALLQFGAFEEYHFFAHPQDIPSIRQKLAQLSFSSDRVRIIEKNLIPTYLSKVPYSLFFTAGPTLTRLAYIRRQFAPRPFPLCGIAYTMSYPEMMEETFLANMMSDVFPCDSIICTSRDQRLAIRKIYQNVRNSLQREKGLSLRYEGRLDRLPLGIQAADYGKLEKDEARSQMGVSQDRIVILYFGRFSIFDKMDLSPILLACKDILQESKNVTLFFAGNDAHERYSKHVEKIAQELGIHSDVQFFVNPSVREKENLYAASDIFVSPSDNIQETFGLTILEAMASGLPVVAADWDGYKDLVVHEKTGFRIPTYWADCNRDIADSSRTIQSWERDHLALSQSVCVDVGHMRRVLSLLVKNKNLRLKLGHNGRKRVREKYDWPVLIPQYEKLWKALFALSQKRKPVRRKTKLFVPEYFRFFSHFDFLR